MKKEVSRKVAEAQRKKKQISRRWTLINSSNKAKKQEMVIMELRKFQMSSPSIIFGLSPFPRPEGKNHPQITLISADYEKWRTKGNIRSSGRSIRWDGVFCFRKLWYWGYKRVCSGDFGGGCSGVCFENQIRRPACHCEAQAGRLRWLAQIR